MKRLTPAMLTALALGACVPSKPPAPPSFLSPLKPPMAAFPDPCLPTPLRKQTDGALNNAKVERAIRAGDADLAKCRADRDRYRKAWPG
jgi:hypothetical protein